MGLKEEVEEILAKNSCYITLIRVNPALKAPGLHLPKLEGYELGPKINYHIVESGSGRAISESPSSIRVFLENVTINGELTEEGTTSSYDVSFCNVTENSGKIQLQCQLEKQINFTVRNTGRNYTGATLCGYLTKIEKGPVADELSLPDLDSLFK